MYYLILSAVRAYAPAISLLYIAYIIIHIVVNAFLGE